MTQPDIYTVEARRWLAESWEAQGFWGMKKPYLCGEYDTNTDVTTLAATLRELNWQPPVDPDLLEARKIAEPRAMIFSGIAEMSAATEIAIAAIKRGRELEATERGA